MVDWCYFHEADILLLSTVMVLGLLLPRGLDYLIVLLFSNFNSFFLHLGRARCLEYLYVK
jgi:hypothetical protein